MTSQYFKDIFSKNLALQLNLKNKKAVDLVNDLGFTQPAVSQWLNGKKYPRMDKVQMIANYLGCKLTDLVGTEAEYISRTYTKRTTNIKQRCEDLSKEIQLRDADFYFGETKLDEADVEMFQTMFEGYLQTFENVIKAKYGK